MSQYEIVRGLAARDVLDPLLVAPSDGPLRQLFGAENVPVMVRPEAWRGYPSPRTYRRRIDSLARLIVDHDANLVLANTVRTFFAVEAAKLAGVPVVWNLREPNPRRGGLGDLPRYLRRRTRECFDTADRVVFVADATRRDWANAGYSGQAHVIPTTIDSAALTGEANTDRRAFRKKIGVAESDLLVLAVGTLCTRKGQEDLVSALGALPTDIVSRLRFVLLGDSEAEYGSLLRYHARRLPPERRERLRFVPATSKVSDFYRGADLLVLSSRAESYPRVILEAMAFALPIVATPVDGVVEQVEDGNSAIFYAPGDIPALCHAIESLATQPDLRNSLGQSAKTRLARLGNLDLMLDAYEEMLVSIHGK